MTPDLVVMAAGTGGHVPGPGGGARACSARLDGDWLGTAQGMENRSVPALGLPWTPSPSRRARQGPAADADRRAAPAGGVLGLPAHPAPPRPSAVLGMGGYICFPGGLMAALLGKPLVLVNADAAAAEQQGAAAGGRPLAFGVDRARRWRREAPSSPATRCAPRSSLPAPAHGALRQASGPLRCWWSAAAWARPMCSTNLPQALAALDRYCRAPAGHAPDRQREPTPQPPTATPAWTPRCCPSSTTWRSAWPTAT